MIEKPVWNYFLENWDILTIDFDNSKFEDRVDIHIADTDNEWKQFDWNFFKDNFVFKLNKSTKDFKPYYILWDQLINDVSWTIIYINKLLYWNIIDTVIQLDAYIDRLNSYNQWNVYQYILREPVLYEWKSWMIRRLEVSSRNGWYTDITEILNEFSKYNPKPIIC